MSSTAKLKSMTKDVFLILKPIFSIWGVKISQIYYKGGTMFLHEIDNILKNLEIFSLFYLFWAHFFNRDKFDLFIDP